MKNKVTFILIQPFYPSASSNGPRHRYPSPFSSTYAGEVHFRKGDGRKGFSLLSKKCTTNSFLAYTQTKKNTTFTFPAMVEKVNVV